MRQPHPDRGAADLRDRIAEANPRRQRRQHGQADRHRRPAGPGGARRRSGHARSDGARASPLATRFVRTRSARRVSYDMRWMPPLSIETFASAVDHTLLDAAAPAARIDSVCDDARGSASPRCACTHGGSPGPANASANGLRCAPSRASRTGSKRRARRSNRPSAAVADGASEIDMVMAWPVLRDGDGATVLADWTRSWRPFTASAADACVKVIVESSQLSQDELISALQLVAEAGADYAKTSTGFAGGGATVAAVATMRSALPQSVGVKASGGIRTAADAAAMLAAGRSGWVPARRLPSSRKRRSMPSLDRHISETRRAVDKRRSARPQAELEAAVEQLKPIRPFTEWVGGEEIAFILRAREPYLAEVLEDAARAGIAGNRGGHRRDAAGHRPGDLAAGTALGPAGRRLPVVRGAARRRPGRRADRRGARRRRRAVPRPAVGGMGHGPGRGRAGRKRRRDRARAGPARPRLLPDQKRATATEHPTSSTPSRCWRRCRRARPSSPRAASARASR